MRIFGFETNREKRSVKMTLKDPKQGWLSQFYSASINTVPVTVSNSLGVAAYWRCVNLITSSIASLPIKLHSYDDHSNTIVNRAVRALRSPNPNITSFTYNEMLIGAALIYGNGYAYIDNIGRSIELIPMHPDNVEPFMYDGELFYNVTVNGEKQTISKELVIHLRGFGVDPLKGLSPLDTHRQTLGLALSGQRESVNFYAKGTKIDGYIKMPGKLDQSAKDALKANWSKNYGQGGSSGTAVLDHDMEYVRLGMPPSDAKFIENAEYTATDIATIFGVPAHMINKLDRSTHSNIEHQKIEFVTFCLMPWVRRLEQEYEKKLLTTKEKEQYYFKYNANALMRGDSKARAEHLRIMVNAGIMTRGEARKLEDLDTIEGDDILYVPMNMIPITKAEEFHQSVIDGKQNIQNNNQNEQ